ncbi:hypothetical protein L9G16_23590, partial [Shewanella sp. A25]|nr:hypothetical protein [Shewanella shenzhenensis]
TSLSTRMEVAIFGEGSANSALRNQSSSKTGAASASAEMARAISSSDCWSTLRQSDVPSRS